LSEKYEVGQILNCRCDETENREKTMKNKRYIIYKRKPAKNMSKKKTILAFLKK